MRREEAEEGYPSPPSDDRAAFGRRPAGPYLDIRVPVAPSMSGAELDPHAYFVEWQLPDAVSTR